MICVTWLCCHASADFTTPPGAGSVKVANPETRIDITGPSTAHPDMRQGDKGASQSLPGDSTVSGVESSTASPGRFTSFTSHPAAKNWFVPPARTFTLPGQGPPRSFIRLSRFKRSSMPPGQWTPRSVNRQSRLAKLRSKSGTGTADQSASPTSSLSSRVDLESCTNSWINGNRSRQGRGSKSSAPRSLPQNTTATAPHKRNRAQRREALRTDSSRTAVPSGPVSGTGAHSSDMTAGIKPRQESRRIIDRSRGNQGRRDPSKMLSRPGVSRPTRVLTAEEIRARILDAGSQGALLCSLTNVV